MAQDIISSSLRGGQIGAAVQSISAAQKQMASMEKEISLKLTNNRGTIIGGGIPDIIADSLTVRDTCKQQAIEASFDVIRAFTPYQLELFPGQPWYYAGIRYTVDPTVITLEDTAGAGIDVSCIDAGDYIRILNTDPTLIDSADDDSTWVVVSATAGGVITLTTGFATNPVAGLDTTARLVWVRDESVVPNIPVMDYRLNFTFAGAATQTLVTPPLYGTFYAGIWVSHANITDVDLYQAGTTLWSPAHTTDEYIITSTAFAGESLHATVTASAAASADIVLFVEP